MKRLSFIALSAVLFSACASTALADTAEIAFFRGIMTPFGLNPPTNIQAGAPATLICHIVRGTDGKVNSGSVTFVVGYGFPGPTSFTALDIHQGAAGTNGAAGITAPLGPGPLPSDPSGFGLIQTEAEIPSTDTAGVATLTGMLATPDQFYIDLHTSNFPNGAIRAQLNRANFVVPMTLMSATKVVPAGAGTATAPAQLVVLTARDKGGAITSTQLIFDVNLNFGKKTTVNAVHIHRGDAGVAGPVAIDSGLGQGFFAPVTTDANGVGNLRQFTEVDMSNPEAAAAVQGLITNPRSYYMDVHTTDSGAAPAARDQISGTDFDKFFMTLSPPGQANATTPPYSPTAVLVHNLRAEDGTVLVGSVMWISNFRFPGKTAFTGLDLYEGAEGTTGQKRTGTPLSANFPFPTDTGFGNIFFFTTISDPTGVAAMNGLMKNPDNYYVALLGPDGSVAARAQVIPANTALPAVTSIGNSANGGPAAPGGVISIYGTNLAKFISDPYDARTAQAPGFTSWFGRNLPTTINGTSVTIDGVKAPLLYVGPTQINAQVPLEVTGRWARQVVVTNSNGAGPATSIPVGEYAPAIFTTSAGASIVKAKDYSLVSASNPAGAGDVLIVYATGLGGTAPPFSTGQIITGDIPTLVANAPLTAKIGATDATVQTVTGVVGFAGLYAVTLTVPSGIPAGTAKLQLKAPLSPLSALGFVPDYSTSAAVDIAIK